METPIRNFKKLDLIRCINDGHIDGAKPLYKDDLYIVRDLEYSLDGDTVTGVTLYGVRNKIIQETSREIAYKVERFKLEMPSEEEIKLLILKLEASNG